MSKTQQQAPRFESSNFCANKYYTTINEARFRSIVFSQLTIKKKLTKVPHLDYIPTENCLYFLHSLFYC